MLSMEARMSAARNHFSHPSQVLGDWQPLGPDSPFINEYLGSCVVTLMFALPFYFLMSTILHLIYFHWFKDYFTPRHLELRY
jgi:hypothetical protein